jgi:hypothetical protein
MKRLFPVLALVAACTELPPDESTITAAASGNCTNGDCGMNTSLVNGTYFSDLNFFGDENHAGMVISGYEGLPPGARLAIVERNRLVAINAGGAVIHQHNALVGKAFLLDLDGITYRVKILQVHEEFGYWAGIDPYARLETYTFGYVKLTDPTWTQPTPMCPSTPHLGNTVKSDAVVFKGNLYDAETKEIYAPGTPGWFNVACRGSAPFKSFFMRHTWASSNAAHQTSNLEQKALLDAWTANYCGDGRSFTIPNHPLRLRDKYDWIEHDSDWSWLIELGDFGTQLDSYEAIWNGDGAVCLNEPRRFGNNAAANKLIREEITKHCAAQNPPRVLEPCSKDDMLPADWTSRGHILTANPL